MDMFADGLRDIRGMDISPWHIWLATIGHWLLPVLLLAGIAVSAWWGWKQWSSWRIPGWSREAERQLNELAGEQNAKLLIDRLALLLKQVTTCTHGRMAVASLEGERWLRWLSQHDPSGFDWVRQGKALIVVPYSPGSPYKPEAVQPLLEAVRQWVFHYRHHAPDSQPETAE